MSNVVKKHPPPNIEAKRPLRVSQSNSPTHRQRRLTKKLTLLNRLVRSGGFQFMIGNLHWSEIRRRRQADPEKKYIHAKQTYLEKLLDLLVFSMFVVAAPFCACKELLTSYWAKFILGVICGLAVVYLIYQTAILIGARFVVE